MPMLEASRGTDIPLMVGKTRFETAFTVGGNGRPGTGIWPAIAPRRCWRPSIR
jgi:hypothetical protein